MMHGHGQSDSPVVPTKVPNKAGEPAAEGMEGRGLAKGNPCQHRTGSVRSVRWSGYGRWLSGTSRCGSRRSCTTCTTSTICAGPTTR
jgi:hypothetical protein